MEERIPNNRPGRGRRRRRRRFPRRSFAAVFFAAAACFCALLWFGGKSSGQELSIKDASGWRAAQAQDRIQGGLLAENTAPPDNGTDWSLMLVNAENAVPKDYEITLKEVSGGETVDGRIYEPLMEMLEAAREGNQGQLPLVVSGYRTQEKQQQLFDDKKAKYQKEGYSDREAETLAKQWVAVPGYSEHQIGLAVDINGAVYDCYFWLQENSYKYGFIFRYPGDKTDITGVAEELWHYRYVGVEAATEIYENGLCLEEYLREGQAG